MEYEEFRSSLLQRMNAEKPDDVKAYQLTTVHKTNGDMEAIRPEYTDDYSICPTIYPLALYNPDLSLDEVYEIADAQIRTIQMARATGPDFDISMINAETAKEHLYLTLCTKEWNPTLVDTTAHIEMLDLIAYPRWRVDLPDEYGAGSIVVTHDMQRALLRMTDDELLDIARRNTISQPYTIRGISEVMAEIMGPDLYEIGMPTGQDYMYVVSTENTTNGATALLSKDVLHRAQEICGEQQFYIIPSSIHEILVLPASKVDDPADLQAMCKEVNENEVAVNERLGENIYHFDGRKLAICNSMEDLQQLTKEAIPEQIKHQRKVNI